MSYIPLTADERAEMLATIGASSVEELFGDVPAQHRYPSIPLPPPLAELDVLRELRTLSEMNADLDHIPSFLGAGAYQHYIPSLVNHLLLRGEFYTAYTPYQPEISQGTLQAIFEYQTMICALTGMEVANASHYDGATALAEGVLMAWNSLRGKRRKAILSPDIHPEYCQVVRTYVQGLDVQVCGDENAQNGVAQLEAMIDDETCCVAVQNPNCWGEIESVAGLRALADAAHAHKAMLIVVGYPIALGLISPPGDYGADIALGEAQPLGSPPGLGGPYLGYFACRQRDVHKMAGRLVGQTVDVDGRRGFVLTLAAREQHIKRERATSNICTNQALCALASAIYLAALGRQGLRDVAELCYHKAHYLAGQIAQLDGYRLCARRPFFNEFVVACPCPAAEINDILLHRHHLIGGLDLAQWGGNEHHMLLCATEVHTRAMLDVLVSALKEAAQ